MQPDKTTRSIAKITPPRLAGIVPRERLYRLLDQSPSITWITAPAGAGKTTFVSGYLESRKHPVLWYQLDAGDGDLASFFYFMGRAAKQSAPRYRKALPLLTQEYLFGLPVFTRRFFEELFKRLTSSSRRACTLVFDNCQDVPPDSGFHEMLVHALETVPEGVRIIVISRSAPPQQHARLLANKRMGLIDWDTVRFSRDEAMKLIGLQCVRTDGRAVDLIHEMTEGWAAGIVLITSRMTKATLNEEELRRSASGHVFDYLAGELFDRTDAPIREMLLKTSFFFRFTAEVAGRLTGNVHAGGLLEQLCRDHYFTERHIQKETVYQYHPLFRAFLRARAGAYFSATEISGIKRDAALLLEQSGQQDDAVELYLDAGEVNEAIRLILSKAQGMAAQGRSVTLEGWLKRLPDAVVEEHPWLSYFRGACRMSFDLREARSWFERSHQTFKTRPDTMGVWLAWCGIVETILFEWGDLKPAEPWLEELEILRVAYPSYPDIDIELRVMIAHLAVLMQSRPGHTELPAWTERLETLLSLGVDPMQRLMAVNNLVFYYMSVRGNMPRANALLARLEAHQDWQGSAPLARISLEQARAACQWQNGEHDKCREAVASGLAIAEQSGVYLMNFHLLAQGIFNSVSNNELSAAQEMLARMKSILLPFCRMQDCEYHYLSSLEAAHRSDVNAMEEHSAAALRAAQETGAVWAQTYLWLARSRACFLRGEADAAAECLDRAQELCTEMGNLIVECGVFEDRALFAVERGDEGKAVEYIAAYMKRMRKGGYHNTPWWRDDTMACLCARALEMGVEPEYVRGLIRKRGLLPPITDSAMKPLTAPLHGADETTDKRRYWERWPWPIRLSTLGRFDILVDDKPPDQGRKSQQKPMALLKALVASGPNGASAGGLADLLWPDAEGDKAQHSLEMALHRLRKMLGNGDSILARDNRLLLNRSLCWVDAFAFAEGLDSGLKALDNVEPDEARVFLERALPLYRGHFLASDEDADLSLSARERLRMKFLIATEKLCGLYEKGEEAEKALDLYRRAVELDELSEELCRRYMQCCVKLGRRTEAIGAYQRLERAMKRVMGLAPSEATILLMQTLF